MEDRLQSEDFAQLQERMINLLKVCWKKHTTMGISATAGLDHIAVAGVAPSSHELHVDEAAGRQAAV